MTKNWKAILGIILIFVLGWLAGAISSTLVIAHRAMALFQRGPEAMVQVMEKRLTRGISLDANQKQQLHGFFMHNFEQRMELQKQIQPQIQELNQQTLKEVAGVLSADQQAKFLANLDYFKQHAGRYFSDPAPANPPEK